MFQQRAAGADADGDAPFLRDLRERTVDLPSFRSAARHARNQKRADRRLPKISSDASTSRRSISGSERWTKR